MDVLAAVLDDLTAEAGWLDALLTGSAGLAPLTDDAWRTPTPALDTPHPATTRLRNVAEIAVRTRDFAFTLHGLRAPAEPFAIQLTAPDQAQWEWGPADAAQKITGTALDFCLVATQRRHRLDTSLIAEGPDADRWLDIAQAFAGPPGSGRKPHT